MKKSHMEVVTQATPMNKPMFHGFTAFPSCHADPSKAERLGMVPLAHPTPKDRSNRAVEKMERPIDHDNSDMLR